MLMFMNTMCRITPPSRSSVLAIAERHQREVLNTTSAFDASLVWCCPPESGTAVADFAGGGICASDHERGDPAIGWRGGSLATGGDSSLVDCRVRDGLGGPDDLGFAGVAVGPSRCLEVGAILVEPRSWWTASEWGQFNWSQYGGDTDDPWEEDY